MKLEEWRDVEKGLLSILIEEWNYLKESMWEIFGERKMKKNEQNVVEGNVGLVRIMGISYKMYQRISSRRMAVNNVK